MTIEVKFNPSYGKERYYPHCEAAKKIADAFHQRCFTSKQIRAIQDLGIKIIIKNPLHV